MRKNAINVCLNINTRRARFPVKRMQSILTTESNESICAQTLKLYSYWQSVIVKIQVTLTIAVHILTPREEIFVFVVAQGAKASTTTIIITCILWIVICQCKYCFRARVQFDALLAVILQTVNRKPCSPM